jgi:uncharacterized membrane protein YozB (DUF420 family)
LGLLGTDAVIEADLNLLLHIGIIFLILGGYSYARRKRINIHEKWMIPSILLAGFSLFAWMLRSYIGNFHVIVNEFGSPGVIITNLHVVFGVITGALAVYILLLMKTEWLPQSLATSNVKRVMRTTFTLWWVTFLLGVSFYVWYYVII